MAAGARASEAAGAESDRAAIPRTSSGSRPGMPRRSRQPETLALASGCALPFDSVALMTWTGHAVRDSRLPRRVDLIKAGELRV